VLGLWFQQAERAKFWLQVLTELKQRGVHDVLICCVDGLKGFPEAIEAVFPETWVQACIVYLIRHSLRFVPDKHHRAVAKDLKRSTPRSTPTPQPKRSSSSNRSGASATR